MRARLTPYGATMNRMMPPFPSLVKLTRRCSSKDLTSSTIRLAVASVIGSPIEMPAWFHAADPRDPATEVDPGSQLCLRLLRRRDVRVGALC